MCEREKEIEWQEKIYKGLFEQENVAKKERKSERERVRERKPMRKASSMSNKEKETLWPRKIHSKKNDGN